jgi:hypothetical protein
MTFQTAHSKELIKFVKFSALRGNRARAPVCVCAIARACNYNWMLVVAGKKPLYSLVYRFGDFTLL